MKQNTLYFVIKCSYYLSHHVVYFSYYWMAAKVASDSVKLHMNWSYSTTFEAV